jgi:hypothetical protein
MGELSVHRELNSIQDLPPSERPVSDSESVTIIARGQDALTPTSSPATAEANVQSCCDGLLEGCRAAELPTPAGRLTIDNLRICCTV